MKICLEKVCEYVSEHLRQLIVYNLIIFLAMADFLSLRLMFMDATFDIDTFSATLCSLVAAICLEGAPTWLGISLSGLKDKTTYRVNDQHVAKFGLVISIVAIILSFSAAITLRIVTMIGNGFWAAYMAGEYQRFPVDIFLTIMPILTSIIAFLSSWLFLQNDNEAKLRGKVERINRKYLRTYQKYHEKLSDLENTKIALWTELTDHKDMPQKNDVFRDESFKRIRRKLIENCLISYPDAAKRFNGAVENKLDAYLIEMSKHTTLPLSITSIDLAKLIDEYDHNCQGEEMQFNYERAKDKLENDLARLLDNAIVTAQKKTKNREYPLEGKD